MKEKINDVLFILMEFISSFFFLFFLFNNLTFYAMQCLMLFLSLNIIIVIQVIFKIKINLIVSSIYELFLIAHFILGEIFSFYIYCRYYDTILHFTSACLISLLAYSLIHEHLNEDYKKIQIFFGFLIGLVSEFIWELIEYCIDEIFHTNMQRYMQNATILIGHQALSDTMKDMFIALCGCLFFVILIQNNKIKKLKIKKGLDL